MTFNTANIDDARIRKIAAHTKRRVVLRSARRTLRVPNQSIIGGQIELVVYLTFKYIMNRDH